MRSLLLPLLPLIAQGHPGHHMGSPLLHHAKELGLSEAQITQLKANADARKDAMKAAHESARAAHQAGSSPAQREAAMAQVHAAMKQAMDEDLAVLTPEQQDHWKALKPNRHPSKGPEGMPHPTAE